MYHVSLDKHLIQLDAAVFSTRQFERCHWAPQGRPLLQPKAYPGGELVVVYAFISFEHGLIQYFAQKKKAYTGKDVARFLKIVANMFPYDDIIFFLDQAGVHKCQAVQD